VPIRLGEGNRTNDTDRALNPQGFEQVTTP